MEKVYTHDPTLVINYKTLFKLNLIYEDVLAVRILDRKVQVSMNNLFSLIKILCHNHEVKEASHQEIEWEMSNKYLRLLEARFCYLKLVIYIYIYEKIFKLKQYIRLISQVPESNWIMHTVNLLEKIRGPQRRELGGRP